MRWSYMEMRLPRKWEYFNKILSQAHLTQGQLEKKRQRRRGREAEINIEAFPLLPNLQGWCKVELKQVYCREIAV